MAVIVTTAVRLGCGGDTESGAVGMAVCLLGGTEDADNGQRSQALYSCGALNKH